MSSDRWLSFAEAAAFLQPFMPDKDAALWLARDDATTDPLIPHRMMYGQRVFAMSDLASFVVRFLDQNAAITEVSRDFRFHQRRRAERRQVVDRRVNPQVVLAPGVERRDYSKGDRRHAQRRGRLH